VSTSAIIHYALELRINFLDVDRNGAGKNEEILQKPQGRRHQAREQMNASPVRESEELNEGGTSMIQNNDHSQEMLIAPQLGNNSQEIVCRFDRKRR
jgi:hypothetical protein